MWMTDYIREIMRQFHDVYGFVPVTRRGNEIKFGQGQIPDGEYPMTIEGKVDKVRMVGGKISCCNYETQ